MGITSLISPAISAGSKAASSKSGGGGVSPQEAALAQYTMGQQMLKNNTNFASSGTGLSTMKTMSNAGALMGGAENLAGKVPVTGIDGIKTAIDAVRAGECAATVSWDPYWQGSMGLSIAYAAKTGKFDPAKEPKEHREFYGTRVLVTKDNVDEFYKSHIESEPKIDFNDLWGRVTGQIRQS